MKLFQPTPLDNEALAMAQTDEIVARFSDLIGGFMGAHDTDVASYKFDCKRYGDFLSVFIERNGAKHANAVNLGISRDIGFVAGYAPDLEGEIGFFGGARPRMPSDYRPHAPIHVETDPSYQNQYGHFQSWGHIAYKIPNAPRPAKDDRIVFTGARTTLLIPAGLGDGVYQRVLDELGTK